MESPLKAALTGLELVLARAQIWEESAAKHVSLGPQLEGVAALATRWRRLELSAWRNLLKTTQHRHAAGMLAPIALSGLVCTERRGKSILVGVGDGSPCMVNPDYNLHRRRFKAP